jgi:DNA-directed RNA polymerase subunit RPC12/RpoP
MAKWVCEFCGQTGRTPAGQTTDEVQCPDCGEPVAPADVD